VQFGGRLLKHAVINPLHVAGGGLQEASGGQMIDGSRQSPREVVNQPCHGTVEDILRSPGLFHLHIEITASLIGQGIAIEKLSFVHDQEQRAFRARRPFKDLGKEPFLAPPWLLAQLTDDHLEQSRGVHVREVTVDRFVSLS
jgi:hypothetical protein